MRIPIEAIVERWGGARSHGYIALRYESVGDLERTLASLGYSFNLDNRNQYALAIEGNQSFAALEGNAIGAFIKLSITP